MEASHIDGMQSGIDEALRGNGTKVLGVSRKALTLRSEHSMTRPMGTYAVWQDHVRACLHMFPRCHIHRHL